ncbi:hypothetical protein DM01DRAFT_1340248 [Hesseltinella vesiculosa]|uniref:Dihydrolipoamide acetyltransferase component of pyruvate dehydrogenase complex n=1 Tax=Hesseltinella vesiculosa TaxID=101127 RepID=A0A1X2G4R8_9FUNG|nr:hypothetical protein DM01DRAFT_1340248 [Hesseltinella vesiculosa]
MPYIESRLRRGFHTSWHPQAMHSFLLADIGEGITECELIQWHVKPGQQIEEFDKICEVQSDKASVEITSRYAGTVKKLYYQPNDIALVGKPLVDIESEGEDDGDAPVATVDSSNEQPQAPTPLSVESASSTLSFPSVKRLAALNGVALADLQGSGKRGSILKQDILQALSGRPLVTKKESTDTKPAAPIAMPVMQTPPTITASDDLSQGQRTMFHNMTESLNIPQLGFKDDVELDATVNYRSQLNDYLAKHPERYSFNRISYLPIFIKTLSIALGYYPILNAYVQGNPQDVHSLRLVYRSGHHVGVAMDTPFGLMVPNIKNVESKSVFEVAAELHRLKGLAQTNSLPQEDLQGGTITLSNVGTISGTYSNPMIVSTSELAILALGRLQTLPRFDASGKVVSRKILPVSWAADHRIIDGGTIARFGSTWKTLIENPALLVSELR